MPTLYTVTVDTEEEWEWGKDWPVTALSVTNIQRLPRFQELCAKHGAATTYYTNHAVFADPQARSTLLDLTRQQKVEIGMHIHPWNTPPQDGEPVSTRSTFLHNLPADVVIAKLNSVYEWFEKCRLKPTSFRGGRYSSGGVIHDFLRDKGFLADASILPYSTWADDGAPDYRGRGLRPERLPPRFPGDRPLWEVPLTLAFTRRPFGFWRRFYETAERSWLRKLHLVGIAQRLGVVRKVWLNFENELGNGMLPFLNKLRRMSLPCICFTVHSSSLVAGKGVYTRTQSDEDCLFRRVDEVLRTLAEWPDFQPATVTEVAQQLEEQYHACAGN